MLRLYVVGGNENGEEHAPNMVLDRLRKLVRANGLGDSVAFLGPLPQEELPQYYAAADVCVLPSRYESFGIVALESLACGTPVVASRVGGLPSIVNEGRTGFLVPAGDASVLADRILLLLRDARLRSRMRSRATLDVRQFDWRRIAGDVLALYGRWAGAFPDVREQGPVAQACDGSCRLARSEGK